jgi:DNA-binding NtrC family response regulator
MTTTMIPNTFAAQPAHSAECPALFHMLIVDDDRAIREACRDAATSLGYRVAATDVEEQALWLIGSENIDCVLLGLKVRDRARLQILREMKQRRNGLEVVIMSADSTARSAVDAIKAGAFEYLTKPFGVEELRGVLDRVSSELSSRIESRRLAVHIKSNGFGGMIGRTPEMDRLYRMISKASQSAHPVLIRGESGTGKELVAHAIHYSGPFRDKPFIPIDCGSLVPTLIESELFGHVKGAFTGAAQSKPGLLAIAEGGTVFLDEIGELALELQAKLLRALQEKEIRPVGGTKPIPINVRILAATNRDLEEAVAKGTFRRDLYFRLNVLNLRIPALRERRKDIPLLATFLLDRMSKSSGRNYSLSSEAIQALVAHDWPGNVRELENCIERCCAMNSGPIIHCVDLPAFVSGSRQDSTQSQAFRISRLADLEKGAILGAITQLNGDKLMAARLLGIGKTTLYRKLKQYQDFQ